MPIKEEIEKIIHGLESTYKTNEFMIELSKEKIVELTERNVKVKENIEEWKRILEVV